MNNQQKALKKLKQISTSSEVLIDDYSEYNKLLLAWEQETGFGDGSDALKNSLRLMADAPIEAQIIFFNQLAQSLLMSSSVKQRIEDFNSFSPCFYMQAVDSLYLHLFWFKKHDIPREAESPAQEAWNIIKDFERVSKDKLVTLCVELRTRIYAHMETCRRLYSIEFS